MGDFTFRRAAPYVDDVLNLPVPDVEASIPFYEEKFGLTVVSREQSPFKRAELERDGVRIGIAENGGDPENEGAFIEVRGLESAFRQMRGCAPGADDIKLHDVNGRQHRAFFVVAPDGLCFFIAEPE